MTNKLHQVETTFVTIAIQHYWGRNRTNLGDSTDRISGTWSVQTEAELLIKVQTGCQTWHKSKPLHFCHLKYGGNVFCSKNYLLVYFVLTRTTNLWLLSSVREGSGCFRPIGNKQTRCLAGAIGGAVRDAGLQRVGRRQSAHGVGALRRRIKPFHQDRHHCGRALLREMNPVRRAQSQMINSAVDSERRGARLKAPQLW